MEDNSTLKFQRRNSVPSAVLIPNSHHHHHLNNRLVVFPGADFELLPLPTAAYTSLKDLLPPSPSSVLSPTPTVASHSALSSSPSNGSSGYEISIRNRLVKQAAWAYLHSAVASEPSSSSRLCFSGEFLRQIFVGFHQFVIDTVKRVYDWLVDALWLLLCR